MRIRIQVLASIMLIFTNVIASEKIDITSPDNKILVIVDLNNEGTLRYSVICDDSIIIKSSKLGIVMTDNDFTKNLKIINISKIEIINDKYSVFSEKKSYCSYQANRRSIRFQNPVSAEINLIFQVSNDGVVFRYEFRNKSSDIKKITDEITSFHFPQDAKAWLHPFADARSGWNSSQPSYEELYYKDIYVGTDAPYKAGWSFPALFRSNGHWVLITEANVERNYCGSRLSAKSTDGDYKITFPQLPERTDSTAATYPQSLLPWYSPWRVIIVGKTLAPIIESTLVTDVSDPCKLMDTTFIKPGKSSWTWVLYKDDSTVYSAQKRFIDYASTMNWRYCLIDAFWDKNIGYDKIQELVNYAREKKVGIILWYNSAGNWNTTPLTPRNMMCNTEIRQKEFEKIHKMGVVGVKIDFFGGDGQSMMAYYHDLFEDAAKYKLLINCHGATIPRGWTRTYPNSVSMEAVRGFEFITFAQSNTDEEPVHCTILPFTRNAIGPMDFTPVCFSEIPGLKRITTNGFELALSILFQSGIQHYAEVPEGMFNQPEYVIDFMKRIPERWENIKFIDGYPGKFAIIARRGNNKWYIAGINGMNIAKEITVDLSVLGNIIGGTLITDGDNNRSFKKQEFSGNKLKLIIEPRGGFVATLN